MKKGLMLLLIVCLALGTGTASFGSTPEMRQASEGSLPESPPGQAMVVNANLLEAFSQPDWQDPKDMENFVNRLNELLPYAPDVLLLSEVRAESTARIVEYLEGITGFAYEDVVTSHEVWIDWNTEDAARRDTAIIVNSDTMRVESEGGFFRTYEGDVDKDHAHLLVKEKRGGLSLAMLSSHYPHGGGLPTMVEQSHEFMKETYTNPSLKQINIIAGDFNVRRCTGPGGWKSESLDCEEQSWYRYLTGQGYTDAVLNSRPDEIPYAQELDVARIDYIFADGPVIDAASDLDNKGEVSAAGCGTFKSVKQLFNKGRSDEVPAPCNDLFYTDHRLLWALVGFPERPNGPLSYQ
jgi:hypothetical protein